MRQLDDDVVFHVALGQGRQGALTNQRGVSCCSLNCGHEHHAASPVGWLRIASSKRWGDTSPSVVVCGRSSYITARRRLIASISSLMWGDLARTGFGSAG